MPSVDIAEFEIVGDPDEAARIRACAAPYRRYSVPAHRLVYVERATLLGPHLLFLQDGRVVEGSHRGARSFSRTHCLHEAGDGRYVIDGAETEVRLEEAVVGIGAKAATGFFHWVVEVLPRLFRLAGSPEVAGVPVLMRPVRQAFQRETLAALGVSPRFETAEVVHTPGAWLPTHMVLPKGHGQLSPEVVEAARAFATAQLGPVRRGRRLYVSRADASKRRVLNEEELRAALARRGFETVVASELSFLDQVRLFAEAEYVIGPHGGGLASLVFCAPGTRVIELCAESFATVSPFRNIAALGGLPYRMWLCQAERVGRAKMQHDVDIKVDLRLLEQAIA